METVSYISDTETKSFRKVEPPQNVHQVLATPEKRLHSVEEFIDKLEQAVLERL